MKRTIRLAPVCLILLLIGGLLLMPSLPTATAQKEETGMSETVLRQIQSLMQEKESRTATQKKIDSQLLYAIKQQRGEPITNAVPRLEVNVNAAADGLVPVDIKAQVTKDLLNAIVKAGGAVIFHSQTYRTINARLPLAAIEQIAASADVQFIYTGDRARTHGLRPASARRMTTDAPARSARPGLKIDPTWRGKLRPDFADRAARVREQVGFALRGRALARSPRRIGSVTSEGDTTHRAAEARLSFGIDGTGVKIGVLSDGVSSLAAVQASGDLPAVTILPGQDGDGDEGTAMLEIIHDLAPGAQLFFATAFISQASFAANIIALRDAGCDIIVDDIGYFREAVFQDDNVAQAVNIVTAGGDLYFSSAGNEGNLTDNTSGVWEGDFVDGGPLTVGATTLPGTVNDFGGGNLSNQVTQSNGGGAPIGLFWADPLGASGNDYDLYIIDAAQTTVVNAATNVQDGNDDPVELSTISPNAGRRLVILKKTGAAARALHLNTFRGALTFRTAGQIHGHAAAAEAYAVAATPADEPIGPPPNPAGPFPGPFNSSNVTELFSSDGPRRIFYNDGSTTPITPGCLLFSCNGGTVRQKPDITAADGTSVTGIGFFTPFYGTSASAPHAAAIAALVKSAVPSITAAQIRTALTSSAIDIETPGVDRDTGFGIVMAFEALQAAGATPQPRINAAGATLVNDSCPPSNGAIDPGERVTVNLQLTNNGAASTTNLVATLPSSANVIAPSNPENYGVIAPGATVGRDFTFTAAGSCGDTITLTLQLQDGANNLGTVTYTFRLGTFTQSSSTFTNNAPINVPAGAPTVTSGPAAPYPSNIAVSGITGPVAKVTVTLHNLSHTWPDDVDVLLVGPQGQKVMLMSDAGDGLNYDLTNATLIFDDAAAQFVPDEGLIPSNATTTYKPTDIGTADILPAPAPGRPYASALAAFHGTNPNGTWSLYVADAFSFDVGAIAGGWSLTITTETGTCNTSCALSRLVVSSTLTRVDATTVKATYRVQNTGTATATNVTLTTAQLGATNGTPLPQPLGSIAPGEFSAFSDVFFTNSTPGASTTLRLNGTYTGGTFSSTKRVTIP